jgi:PQQ-dependent catabolism-associated CXXCW motif protein
MNGLNDMRPGAFCQSLNDKAHHVYHLLTHHLVLVAKYACITIIASFCQAKPVTAQALPENHDWGITPTVLLRQPPYSSPTPMEIPGGLRVTTDELRSMLKSTPLPILIDVASGNEHETLPGAYWLPGAGRGANFIDEVQASLDRFLEKVTEGNRNRALVFFCVNLECWLSYNAALRAVAAGYTAVFWYRGGLSAWRSAGLLLFPMHQTGR